MKEIKAPETRLCGLLVQLAQYISAVCEYNEEFSNTSYKILVYNNYLHLLQCLREILTGSWNFSPNNRTKQGNKRSMLTNLSINVPVQSFTQARMKQALAPQTSLSVLHKSITDRRLMTFLSFFFPRQLNNFILFHYIKILSTAEHFKIHCL